MVLQSRNPAQTAVPVVGMDCNEDRDAVADRRVLGSPNDDTTENAILTCRVCTQADQQRALLARWSVALRNVDLIL